MKNGAASAPESQMDGQASNETDLGMRPGQRPQHPRRQPAGAKKQYQSLFRRYLGQPTAEIFGHFPYDGAAGETWESPMAELAKLAKPEPGEWNFVSAEFRKPGVKFPVLSSYLNYTFLRLQEEDEVRITADGRRACFNTGLQTVDEKDIFAVFSRDFRSGTDDKFCDLFLEGLYDSYSRALNHFRPLPELVSYITYAADLVLDVTYDIDVNVGHILDEPDNKGRLPGVLRDNRNLAIAAIEGATKLLKQKVLRNYKTAIPFWHPPAGRMQLLLPLCLLQPDRADLALVADKDRKAKMYRIRTALRVDMAYNNARLITRPDREWLNP